MISIPTTMELVESVIERGFIPTDQVTLTEDDIIEHINDELEDSLIAHIISYQEEYFSFSQDIPLVNSVNRYAIPYRAIGQKLRDIKYRDTNNNLYEMVRIEPEDRHYFQNGASGSYSAFYLEGNLICLMPETVGAVTGSLALLYYLKPNKLVKENRVGIITNIDRTTGVITLNSLPTQMTPNHEIDMIQGSAGYRMLNFDVNVISIDTVSKTITVDVNSIPSSLVIGDHIASAGECMIPQIPNEMVSMLLDLATAKCLAALNDDEGLAKVEKRISAAEKKSAMLIDNRTEGNPRKLSNHNSILRSGRSFRRRF